VGEERLERYRAMRDFGATPEPAGGPTGADDPRPRFVIQQHDATRLHWDLRLEHDGVLLSWALPNGLPWTPAENHLAVHTEDHPLEYLEFSGDIPAGNYGAGRMTIWDRGRYDPEIVEEGKVHVVLHGRRAEGRYALFPTRGDRDWMIHRMDPPADPDRRPMPTDLRPMRAVPGPLPDDPTTHALEVRWRGCRGLAASSGGSLRLTDAAGAEVTPKVPELRRLGRALGSTEVVLDAVLVTVDGDGRPHPDAAGLDRRLAAGSDSTARRLARSVPVALMLVDVLWLDGHPTIDLAWTDRRALLEELGLAAEAWQTPSAHRGDGAALLAAAGAAGLPGLVAKRLDSRYEPGATSAAWVDVAA
jgi:bifunctional non-homologous end joining protein LigD